MTESSPPTEQKIVPEAQYKIVDNNGSVPSVAMVKLLVNSYGAHLISVVIFACVWLISVRPLLTSKDRDREAEVAKAREETKQAEAISQATEDLKWVVKSNQSTAEANRDASTAIKESLNILSQLLRK